MDFGLMDSTDVAAAAGIKLVSFRVALTRSKERRAKDRAIPSDIPEPDRVIGRSPVWFRETIEDWLVVRNKIKDVGLRTYMKSQSEGDVTEPVE